MKNFLGLPVHPSDEYLHWNDSVKDAIRLRKAWDAIPEGYLPEVRILMGIAYQLAVASIEDCA